MLKRLLEQDDLCTGMDGGKAAHTGRDQQSFLVKPSSHNINGGHDSQVQVWSAVEHENSISAAKAILSGSQKSLDQTDAHIVGKQVQGATNLEGVVCWPSKQ